MLFKIANSLGLLVPPTLASRVEPDNVYMRRTPNGPELVRKRQQQQQQQQQQDNMRRHRAPEPPRRSSLYNHHQEQRDIRRRKSVLQAELARRNQRRDSLEVRKQRLEAELAARAARRAEEEEAARLEAEVRITDRERRPYHRYARPQEPHSPTTSPRTRAPRQRSIRVVVAEPDIQSHGHGHRHRHHSRHSSQPIYQEVDLDTPYYITRSPEQEYFSYIQETSLEPLPRHHSRQCSRHYSHHHQHEEAVVCQQIIRQNRRRNSGTTPCRRRSRQFVIENTYNVEDRDRDDYSYY